MENLKPGIATIATLVVALSWSATAAAQEEKWEPIVGADTLEEFMSGITAERKLPGGGTSKAEYSADGTGVLHSWGESFPRMWRVEGDAQVCITQETGTGGSWCFELERSTADPTLYRLRAVDTGKVIRFRADAHRAVADEAEKDSPEEGGAAAASASEMAAKLADPNAVIGTMTMNFDYLMHDGSLPGAGSESSFTLGFQPSLPYPLGGGKTFFARPLFPILIDQTVPASDGGFESVSGELGNIGFDTAVGFSLEGGKVLVAGVAGSLPTRTDDRAGADQWLLGPELAFFKVGKKGVVGIFATHLWDVAGDDSFDTSLTSGQIIYTILLKDGWSITGQPPWSYNHEAPSGDALTFSVGIGVGKTAFFGGRPWRLSAQYFNFVERPGAFATEHQFKVTVGPVVSLPWGE